MIIGKKNNRRRARTGASMMETALILPILLALTFPIVDYSFYFYIKDTLQAAAAAGARAAAPSSATNAMVTSAITKVMSGTGMANTRYTVTTSPSDVTTATAGTVVTVTISTTWGSAGTNMVAPAFGGIRSSKAILGSVSMVKESGIQPITGSGNQSGSSSSSSSSSGSSSSSSSGSSSGGGAGGCLGS
jgi:Flp pilus assembly protein TadG